MILVLPDATTIGTMVRLPCQGSDDRAHTMAAAMAVGLVDAYAASLLAWSETHRRDTSSAAPWLPHHSDQYLALRAAVHDLVGIDTTFLGS
jgi:hypothetical protein